MATESIDEGPYIKDTYITDKLGASFLPLFQGRRVSVKIKFVINRKK